MPRKLTKEDQAQRSKWMSDYVNRRGPMKMTGLDGGPTLPEPEPEPRMHSNGAGGCFNKLDALEAWYEENHPKLVKLIEDNELLKVENKKLTLLMVKEQQNLPVCKCGHDQSKHTWPLPGGEQNADADCQEKGCKCGNFICPCGEWHGWVSTLTAFVCEKR